MKFVDVIEDDNCLFRAISHFEYGNEYIHKLISKIILIINILNLKIKYEYIIIFNIIKIIYI